MNHGFVNRGSGVRVPQPAPDYHPQPSHGVQIGAEMIEIFDFVRVTMRTSVRRHPARNWVARYPVWTFSVGIPSARLHVAAQRIESGREPPELVREGGQATPRLKCRRRAARSAGRRAHAPCLELAK